jgi:hypothetical protein
MARAFIAVAVVMATATAATTASAVDPKTTKAPKTQTVTVVAAPTPEVAVVTPVPVAPPSEPPADRPGFSAGAIMGLGSTGLGFGIGARAGYTLPLHLYLGAGLDYFLSGSLNLFSIAPEVGYDIALPAGGLPFLLRPYVGFGYANINELGAVGGAFVVYPGFEFLYDVIPNLFVGVDVRVPIVTAGGATAAFNGFLTAGYKM